MGIIYCYTNLINNKKYIGQTINPHQRFLQHRSSAFNEKDKDYDSPLHRAFRKYGYENFKYEVLAEADTIEELNGLEIYYIAHFNTKENGYNIEMGGKNSNKPKSEETKKKLMKSHSVLSEEEVIYLRNAAPIAPIKLSRVIVSDKCFLCVRISIERYGLIYCL